MKQIILILTFGLFFTSCKSDKIASSVNRDASYLPPMEIAIDPSIKADPELVDLVESSEAAINEFSDNVEKVALESKDLLKKINSSDNQSAGDLLRVMNLVTKFTANSGKIMSTMEKFDTYTAEHKEQGKFSEEQAEALDKVGNAFKERMTELGKKYEKLFEELGK